MVLKTKKNKTQSKSKKKFLKSKKNMRGGGEKNMKGVSLGSNLTGRSPNRIKFSNFSNGVNPNKLPKPNPMNNNSGFGFEGETYNYAELVRHKQTLPTKNHLEMTKLNKLKSELLGTEFKPIPFSPLKSARIITSNENELVTSKLKRHLERKRKDADDGYVIIDSN